MDALGVARQWQEDLVRNYVSILVIPLFLGYLIGVHVCNFSLHTLNIYGLYIYIHIMYVSFPHQLSKKNLGGGFKHFLFFYPYLGKNKSNLTSIFFKMGWIKPPNIYMYGIPICCSILFQQGNPWGFPPFFRPKRPSGGTEVLVLFGIKEPSEVHDHRLKRGGVWRERFLFLRQKTGEDLLGIEISVVFLWCLCWCYCQIDILLLQ